jgi:MerR family transcriptional regulator, redox-sensitive transcriptional activator SoxR
MQEELEIGEVARRAGLRPSAVRYYESRGLLAPDRRNAGGRRLYSAEAVERLALIRFARNIGFSLDEIRSLFHGFPEETPPSERWTGLVELKLSELEAMSRRIETMRAALHRMARCRCVDLDQCAHHIAATTCDNG